MLNKTKLERISAGKRNYRMDTFRFYTREDTPAETIRQIVDSLENIRDSHQCNFEILATEDLQG